MINVFDKKIKKKKLMKNFLDNSLFFFFDKKIKILIKKIIKYKKDFLSKNKILREKKI